MTYDELHIKAEEQAKGAKSAVQYMTKHENYIEGFTQGFLAGRDASAGVVSEHCQDRKESVFLQQEIKKLGES